MTESQTLPLQQRQHGEQSKAHAAYIDYRDMGVSRSLRKLHEVYTAPDTPQDCPTKHLTTIETWSSRYKWQDRITEWEQHQYDKRDEELEKDRHAERLKRSDLLEKFRNKIEKQMYMASLSEDGIKAFDALTRAFKAYADISMKHYNDLPVERKDLTTKDKAINVNFITEPVSEDKVRNRLEELGLADFVEDQIE